MLEVAHACHAGFCQSFSPTWTELGHALAGTAHVATLDTGAVTYRAGEREGGAATRVDGGKVSMDGGTAVHASNYRGSGADAILPADWIGLESDAILPTDLIGVGSVPAIVALVLWPISSGDQRAYAVRYDGPRELRPLMRWTGVLAAARAGEEHARG